MRKGEQTRQRIIDVSLQLFSVKGYFNTSINDIMQAAKLTKGGLYVHFKTKEEIWWASYNKAVVIWKHIVFNGLNHHNDPVGRIKKALENDLNDYLGKDVFAGGCFFLNMMVELSGQDKNMSQQAFKGIVGFAEIISSWLKEAEEKKLIRADLDHEDIGNYIITILCGVSALYAASKDKKYLNLALSHVESFLGKLSYW